MAASASIQALESLLRDKGLGKALPKLEKPRYPPAPTGWEALDARLKGGLPRGAISEVLGPQSSGRTGLLFSVLARATQAGEAAVYVDASDSLDPRSALDAGIDLERLLWVRCDPRERPRYERIALQQQPVDQAWQAANLVASAGGFGLVVIDLGGVGKHKLREWQLRQWVRLKHAVENTPTALAVLAEAHVAGSAAGLRLELSRAETHWRGGVLTLLDGMKAEIAVSDKRLGAKDAGRGTRAGLRSMREVA